MLSMTKKGVVDWLVNVSGAPKGQGLDQTRPFCCALAPGWLL